MGPKQLEKYIKDLSEKRFVDFNGEKIKLACLLREEDRRPFQAEWWKGKYYYLVAEYENGNFICGIAEVKSFALILVQGKRKLWQKVRVSFLV